tara:strand:+ start:1334 stop:1780 length:447 start_codon:yes stop_codon:yes gene_type:complete
VKELMTSWRDYTGDYLIEGMLEDAAATLKSAYQFNQQIKSKMADAPDEPNDKEKAMFEKIVQPALDHLDKITDITPSTREELQAWRKEFRPAVKGTMDALKQMYQQGQEEGFTISKPYLEMLVKKSNQELEQAQKMLKATAEALGGKG